MSSKASTGKGIIKRGMAKEALKIIVNAKNIDSMIIVTAQKYLDKLNGDV